MIHHRSEEFQSLVKELQSPLKQIMGSDRDVALLTCSGTGGMEAAIRSILQAKDSVLVVNAGKFGARFGKIAESYGIKVDSLTLPWGQAVSLSDVEKHLKPSHAAVLIQHSETSTGVLHPLPEIARWLKGMYPDCLLMVDGITSIGALPFEMKNWNIDVAVTGSQKALMLPPGLAMVSISERAEARMKTSNLPGFYLDLKRELEAVRKGQTAFTPAIGLVRALKVSLDLLLAEGLKNVFDRHQHLAEATRKALGVLGLKIATDHPGVACSPAFFPSGIDGKKLLKAVRERSGFHIAGAQDDWEGKVLRLSHLGYYSPYDLLAAIAALGRELERAKAPEVRTSAALETFMETYGL